MSKQRKESIANRFGISVDVVEDYNSGSCYDRIWVKTRAAAKIVKKAMAGTTVNGGMFHGMPLGQIEANSDGTFSVMC